MDDNEIEKLVQEIQNEQDLEQAKTESLSFLLASEIMKNFQPGFAVVCSPTFELDEQGRHVPSELGISINASEGFTKSVVAEILKELIEALEQEVLELEKDVNRGH